MLEVDSLVTMLCLGNFTDQKPTLAMLTQTEVVSTRNETTWDLSRIPRANAPATYPTTASLGAGPPTAEPTVMTTVSPSPRETRRRI